MYELAVKYEANGTKKDVHSHYIMVRVISYFEKQNQLNSLGANISRYTQN